MNKKLVIVAVIVGIAVLYFYNKNKKTSEPNKSPNESNNTGMATEKDALELADKLKEKNKPLPNDKMSKFVEQYKNNIDKKTHTGLMTLFSKQKSELTSEDNLYTSTFNEKVLKPLAIK